MVELIEKLKLYKECGLYNDSGERMKDCEKALSSLLENYEKAKLMLPEKRSETVYCDPNYGDIDRAREIVGEDRIFNQAIDLCTPAYAKLLVENSKLEASLGAKDRSLCAVLKENEELKEKLNHSHHVCCNYPNRQVGKCNCESVMKHPKAKLSKKLSKEEIAGIVGKCVCKYPDRVSVTEITEAIYDAQNKEE